MAQLALFQDLSPSQLSLILALVEICKFPENQAIFEQGEQADHLFIVISGEVIVRYKPYDGPDIVVARIGPGGVFGWSAALGRSVYTSAAISDCPSEVFRFKARDLQKLYEQNPEIGNIVLDRLATVIAERLRSTHNQVLAILTQGIDLDGEHLRKSGQNE